MTAFPGFDPNRRKPGADSAPDKRKAEGFRHAESGLGSLQDSAGGLDPELKRPAGRRSETERTERMRRERATAGRAALRMRAELLEVAVRLEPRLQGFLQDVLDGVWRHLGELPFQRCPLEGVGQVG